MNRGCLRCVIISAMDCGILVSEFGLQSRYYVHFRKGINSLVAARKLHFCLARNLIRPLRSTHNFTQSGWPILFIPHLLSEQQKLGKLPNTFFLQQHGTMREKQYNSLDPLSILPRPRDPSWIWVRYIQYATHKKNFISPPKLAMSMRCLVPLRHLALISPLGNIFWSHSRFSPKQPETQTHGDSKVYFLQR